MLTITHDIKAPVGSILGYTDLLERITTEERQRFYLNNMQSSANHLLSLVKSLLDYHRLDAHKMDVNQVSFNPHQLFDTIYISFKPMADSKQLELNYHCNESLNRVYIGDPFRIRQIAENLLSNALKFTKEGGITLRAALENGQLHFSISDTGCGISQEEQQRIFQEFTRLHNAQGQEGFGLGLAITRKLVLLLEGDIKIESEQDKGSCFHVYLPLPEGPSHPDENLSGPGAEHTPASPDATGIRQTDTPREDSEPIHLILIDDDRIQLQLTTAMLERPGVTVTCCHHPEELLNQLKEKRFDVLLTDIQMPAMNGFDLLKAIRTLDTSWVQTLPVIALTARSDMDENYFCSHGFAGCLHKPFTVKDLGVAGAITVLLKDALSPNLVQTTEHTAAFVHGGPFANIAHGCNSILATKMAMTFSDYTITEAGFGADLGAEKFYDIKCRKAGITPKLTVLVVTARALKMHGGVSQDKIKEPNLEALKQGVANMDKHLRNLRYFGQTVVVAFNRYGDDSEEEVDYIRTHCEKKGVGFAVNNAFTDGGEGAVELAELVVKTIEEQPSEPLQYAYDDEDSVETKISKVACNLYGASIITYSAAARKKLKHIVELGYGNFPICIAKTQYSFSTDPKIYGAVDNFEFHVQDIVMNAGAEMLVVIAGEIMRMPGLPKEPQALHIDIVNGEIEGLS